MLELFDHRSFRAMADRLDVYSLSFGEGSPRAATNIESKSPLILSLSKDSSGTNHLSENKTAEQLLKNAFHDLYNEEKIKLISTDDLHYITLTHYYFSEKGTAQKLLQLLQYPPHHTINSNEVYQALRAPNA